MFAVRPMFSGGSGVVVPLPGGTFIDAVLDPADAAITLSFFANGEVYANGLLQHNWYLPTTSSIGNGYWIRATLTGGTTPTSGTLGSWLQLNTTRDWSNQRTTPGNKTSTLLIEIATDSGGTNIVTSGTYTITAQVDA